MADLSRRGLFGFFAGAVAAAKGKLPLPEWIDRGTVKVTASAGNLTMGWRALRYPPISDEVLTHITANNALLREQMARDMVVSLYADGPEPALQGISAHVVHDDLSDIKDWDDDPDEVDEAPIEWGA